MREESLSVKRRHLQAFGPVWDGAGIRGFDRTGYWYHPYVPRLRRALATSTFVTKTITTYPTQGNMRLDASYRPAARFPDCIHINFREGYALNAVGLSGPGIGIVLKSTSLTKIREPLFISYMPVLSEDEVDAGHEVREFVSKIKQFSECDVFSTKHLGLQLNITCPNVGADLDGIVHKAGALLDQFTPLRIPVVVKLNLLVPPEVAARIAAHPTCTGLCIANSVPFGTVLPDEWWQKHFPNGSPLAVRKYGKGGLSGAPIFPYVLRWLLKFRRIDQDTYVNAGGGIMSAGDVEALYRAGADSIFFSSVMMLRPWRVPSIIRRARELF